MQMNLAAMVVPGVISGVCVLVGVMTLHEYCGPKRRRVAERQTKPARVFFPSEKLGDVGAHFAAESRVLSYAKIAAVSFYAASFLTTVCSDAFLKAKSAR